MTTLSLKAHMAAESNGADTITISSTMGDKLAVRTFQIPPTFRYELWADDNGTQYLAIASPLGSIFLPMPEKTTGH